MAHKTMCVWHDEVNTDHKSCLKCKGSAQSFSSAHLLQASLDLLSRALIGRGRHVPARTVDSTELTKDRQRKHAVVLRMQRVYLLAQQAPPAAASKDEDGLLGDLGILPVLFHLLPGHGEGVSQRFLLVLGNLECSCNNRFVVAWRHLRA